MLIYEKPKKNTTVLDLELRVQGFNLQRHPGSHRCFSLSSFPLSVDMHKTTLRKNLLNLRKCIPIELRSQLNEAANHNLIEFIQSKMKTKPIKSVALFHSFNDEIDTKPTIKFLLKNDIIVCLPVIHPFTPTQLLFQTFNETTEQTKNKFGIIEPKLNVQNIILKESIDLIIVPLVGFDAMGNRLGMGGGFYDRTFEHFTFIERLIGFAYSLQKVDSIPVDPWDLRISRVISDAT